MATLIWLTEIDSKQPAKILANLDNVRHIRRYKDATYVYFAKGDDVRHVVHVTETPEEIHTLWLHATKSTG